MTFQARLVLLVTGLLTAAIIIDSSLHAWKSYEALLRNAELSAERVAGLLARSAAFGAHVGRDLEAVTGEMMTAQARLTALYVAAAERAGLSPEEMNRQLAETAAKSQVDEFWVTDEKGHAYIHSLDGVDFTFDPDPAKQPQAHMFWPLLTGAAEQVVQEARRREIDGQVFKYVGVPGIDRPRIVEVGVNVGFLDALAARMGLPGLVGALVGEGDINAIWVLNRGLDTLAHASLYGTEVNPAPGPEEIPALAKVVADGQTTHVLGKSQLTVVAPVRDNGMVIGAALVRLSTTHMDRAVREQMWMTALSALVVIGLGITSSVVLARRQTRPIKVITRAAHAMEHGQFEPASLEGLSVRRDEFGTLAQVFQGMAREVAAREERLDAQVRERTSEIEGKHLQLMAAHRRIDEELEIARSFQIAMLPQHFVQEPSHQVFGFMCPAREVGGDFYDHFAIDEHRVCLVVGDVSGKGVPAALFMVQARNAVQAAIAAGMGPAAALAAVNRRLVGSNPLELFVTIFLASYDRRSGVLTYANAGHPPPLLIEADGSVRPLPRQGGMVAGMFEDLEFGEAERVLEPGQAVFLYSDGFTEAMDPGGALFGEARLADVLRDGARLSAQALAVHAATAVDHFAATAEQADDITCLVLRCQGTETNSAPRQAAASLAIALANQMGEIPRVMAAIEAFCVEFGFPERTLGHIRLAVDEALANVINYAWTDQAPHQAQVAVACQDGRLTMEISDDGMAFDPLSLAAADVDAPLEQRRIGGLGIHFIRSVMDEVRYRRDGGRNILTMVKRVGG